MSVVRAWHLDWAGNARFGKSFGERSPSCSCSGMSACMRAHGSGKIRTAPGGMLVANMI